jgi:DNA-binding MarR family transcriptional regulator
VALDRTGNLLGALATAIADRTGEAVSGAAGRSESAAAALSALLHFLDRPSVDLLRRVLGLTSSGTVRLLDRLADTGYVDRLPGTDGRSTAVVLTPAGRQAAEQVAAARAEVLHGALAALTLTEQQTFERLASKVLVGMVREPGATRWTCRLCDTTACGRHRGECPVSTAAQARYGSSPDRQHPYRSSGAASQLDF